MSYSKTRTCPLSYSETRTYPLSYIETHTCPLSYSETRTCLLSYSETRTCPLSYSETRTFPLSYTETIQYSRLSLFRPHLSGRIAYLKAKILFLFLHGNLTTYKKYCGKEEKWLLRSRFSSFPQYFQYIANFRSQNTYSFVKCGCLVYYFPQFRKSDMSRYGYLEVFQRFL